MSDPQILFTGDYWHAEFQSIVANFPVPVTLVPIDRLVAQQDQSLDLIVLVQTRPDQISAEVVESLQTQHPTTPIVALLGSWCEGGMRTDVPWPGVRRIYWHQWNGRFDLFSKQLAKEGVTLWHQPATASHADDATARSADVDVEGELLIGVSARDQMQFEHLRDAIEIFGWQACWIERSSLEPSTIDSIAAVCIDGNSVSDDLVKRIGTVRQQLDGVPLTVVLNFPRLQEVQAAHELGVAEIVSKPFTTEDLKFAIERSIAGAANLIEKPVPKPHARRSAKPTVK